MKIIPIGNLIQLEIEEAKAGDLLTSSRESAVEYAKVVGIGEMALISGRATNFKLGDYVFVKAWAIDIITYEGKKYYFVNLETNGILALVK